MLDDVLGRYPPPSWIRSLRARLDASAKRPPGHVIVHPRQRLAYGDIAAALVDAYERITTSALAETSVTDGVRTHPHASWTDRAQVASTGEGLLERSMGGDDAELGLDLGARGHVRVVVSPAADLSIELRARGNHELEDSAAKKLETALVNALASVAHGPRGALAGDISAHRRRRSVDAVLQGISRELVATTLFDLETLREALLAVFDAQSPHPLPRVLSTAKGELDSADEGYVNGLGYGVVSRRWSTGSTTLTMNLTDDRIAYAHSSLGRVDNVTVKAKDGAGVAVVGDAIVAELARRGIRLEPQLGPLQRMRERAWDAIYVDPRRWLHFDSSPELDREPMRELLERLFAEFAKDEAPIEEVKDGRSVIQSTRPELADVGYTSGGTNGIAILSCWYGSYPGDALESNFVVLLPDGAVVHTDIIDSCSMNMVDFVLTGPNATVDALERYLDDAMGQRGYKRREEPP